jgi:hypothetical protein
LVGDDVRTRSRAAVAGEQKAAPGLQEYPNR